MSKDIKKVNLLLLSVFVFFGIASAYNNQCNNNVVNYWGQNSYGAANSTDKESWQRPLRFYCEDDSLDVLPIAFLTTFFGTGGEPQINLANYCNSVDNATFPGTSLANCQSIASDIEYCQNRGKLITLSLGGATGGVGFQSDSQASGFADTLWNLFLGGNSSTRPFGNAVLDGIDLDIEGGGPNHYIAFLTRLSSYFKNSSKKYYVTAAPQCIYPDANLQTTLNGYPFDAVYVQFYNNPCGLQNYESPTNWNFGVWDIWARTISPNPDVKIYIGAPASDSAAGGGYTDVDRLTKIALDTRKKFPSFGGVMFWDASQAYRNNRIDAALKAALKPGEICDDSFTFPECSAPAFAPGSFYTANAMVSHNYIWASKWWTSSEPSPLQNFDWSPVSTCSGVPSKNSTSDISSQSKSLTLTATTLSQSTSSQSNISPLATATLSQENSSASIAKSLHSELAHPNNSILIVKTTKSEIIKSTVATTFTIYYPPSSIPHPTHFLTTFSSFAHSPAPTVSPKVSPTTENSHDCGEAWSSEKSYTGGSTVVYENYVWTARWWSFNDLPGGPVGVWVKGNECPSTLVARSLQDSCKHKLKWNRLRQYQVNSKVVYKGYLYVANQPNTDEVPDIYTKVWTKEVSCSS